jgi:DNA-binding MurR/RpiR family transcriptional regulator
VEELFVGKDNVLKSISAIVDKLPKNQQLVASYIMHNWDKALHESSVAIAKKIGVSQSTVVRTVASLGYKGFPEFQEALQVLLQDRVSTIKRIEQISSIQEGQSIEQKIAKVFALQQENLQVTLHNLDIEQIIKAAKVIWKGRRVIIVGLRSSAGLAHYLGLHLSMIREEVVVISNDYLLLENISTSNAGDVLVVFSFSRYYRITIDAAKLARERGYTIIGITDNIAAPLTPLADYVFYVPITSMHFSSSYIPAFALIDVLLSIIGTENKDDVTKALKSMEDGFQKLNTHIYSPKIQK